MRFPPAARRNLPRTASHLYAQSNSLSLHTHTLQPDPAKRSLLTGLAAGVAGLAATAVTKPARADDAVAASRMSYSRFLEYLDMGRVTKVRFGGKREIGGAWLDFVRVLLFF